MTPLPVRRYRAERLLREEFDTLRAGVIAVVRERLRSAGVRLDGSDLEACYSQAWHGLYTAVLEGQQIANAAGWLVLATFRRAIDAQRASEHGAAVGTDADAREVVPASRSGGGVRPLLCGSPTPEDDLAHTLDDRVRLRQLFEALRGRLSERELQAAALCYLQGMSRAQAAARMGVSEARMRKLMDGQGPRRPGVAGKVGALVETIRAGAWCEEQGSLMRAFAYGILDTGGQRYRVALAHQRECPACRAYVLSLRGLAAALPPVPALLLWARGALAAAGLGTGPAAAANGAAGPAAAANGGAGPAGSAAGAHGAALAPAGSAVGEAVCASGAGAGAASGGWLLVGGPAGAKLAVGCLVALGIGAGCVAFSAPVASPGSRSHRPHARAAAAPRSPAAGAPTASASGTLAYAPGAAAHDAGTSGSATPSGALTPAARAGREFGPEQGEGRQATGDAAGAAPGHVRPAVIASAGGSPEAAEGGGAQAANRSSESASAPSAAATSGAPAAPASPLPAEREFSPG